jgi:hypothetical protein
LPWILRLLTGLLAAALLAALPWILRLLTGLLAAALLAALPWIVLLLLGILFLLLLGILVLTHYRYSVEFAPIINVSTSVKFRT